MRNLDYLPDYATKDGVLEPWAKRHWEATRRRLWPSDNHQDAVVIGIRSWLAYAIAHATQYNSPIGGDYVLGPAWEQWGRALRDLLNGETGDLDCGTLDSIILDNLTEQGFSE